MGFAKHKRVDGQGDEDIAKELRDGDRPDWLRLREASAQDSDVGLRESKERDYPRHQQNGESDGTGETAMRGTMLHLPQNGTRETNTA